LGIDIPPELAHAPDHLALELSFMALLAESGSTDQQEQFRRQHLDWVAELSAVAGRRDASPACKALLALIAAVVASD
jgi:TorA maturation chaperone TorD